MEQTPDDSMDDFDNEAMEESILLDSDADTELSQQDTKITRRRIEDLIERKRLQKQLSEDFYDIDLPEDL